MTAPAIEYRPLIRDMPSEERPRERLRQWGAAALSNAELLAIVLRTGGAGENVVAQATRLLSRFNGLPGLARASVGELCAEHAVGEAKATQMLAALELGRRLLATHPDERPIVRSPQDIANLKSVVRTLISGASDGSARVPGFSAASEGRKA